MDGFANRGMIWSLHHVSLPMCVHQNKVDNDLCNRIRVNIQFGDHKVTKTTVSLSLSSVVSVEVVKGLISFYKLDSEYSFGHNCFSKQINKRLYLFLQREHQKIVCISTH